MRITELVESVEMIKTPETLKSEIRVWVTEEFGRGAKVTFPTSGGVKFNIKAHEPENRKDLQEQVEKKIKEKFNNVNIKRSRVTPVRSRKGVVSILISATISE